MDKELKTEREKGLEKDFFRKRAVRRLAGLCTVVSSVLYALAFFFDFESDYLIFAAKSNGINVAVWFSVISAVLLLLLPFLVTKRKKPINPLNEGTVPYEEFPIYRDYFKVEHPAVRVARFLCLAAFGALAVIRPFLYLSGRLSLSEGKWLTLLLFLSVIPLALYFAPELLAPISSRAHLFCGGVGLCWFVLEMVEYFRATDIVLSSPYHKISQIVLVVCLLALTYDMKIHTDTPAPRLRLGFLCAGLNVCLPYAAGRLTAVFAGKKLLVDDITVSTVFFALALYFAAELVFYDEY